MVRPAPNKTAVRETSPSNFSSKVYMRSQEAKQSTASSDLSLLQGETNCVPHLSLNLLSSPRAQLRDKPRGAVRPMCWPTRGSRACRLLVALPTVPAAEYRLVSKRCRLRTTLECLTSETKRRTRRIRFAPGGDGSSQVLCHTRAAQETHGCVDTMQRVSDVPVVAGFRFCSRCA
jgi:hypothetical protein